MLRLDFSVTGKNIKANFSLLTLKDATTARSIISSIVSGVISLTVFSFSMVMIILNQAASQLSNRVLNKLIENRFQQIVLGFYIGTIVYALFLLSAIRDTDSGIRVPALSVYLLIILTIADVFFFIYFLHYITQSIKYDTIIQRISRQTMRIMRHDFIDEEISLPDLEGSTIKICANSTGIYQGFETKELMKILMQHDAVAKFLYREGSYILRQTPLMVVDTKKNFSEDDLKNIQEMFTIQKGEDISNNYFFGLRQLKEIALKALSPGINDPGTAVLSLQALTGLLAYCLNHFSKDILRDESGMIRIIKAKRNFDELFTSCILPLWDYGKNDRTLQHSFIDTLTQLQQIQYTEVAESLLQKVKAEMKD